MNGQHWTVCQVLSTRAHLIRADIERSGRGTFLPRCASVRYVDGQRSSSERALYPGYLLVQVEPPPPGERGLRHFYGADGRVKIAKTLGRISDEEYIRVFFDSETGRGNEITTPVATERRRTRRRRPRPGKRWRGEGRVA